MLPLKDVKEEVGSEQADSGSKLDSGRNSSSQTASNLNTDGKEV